jgi:benzodiazapine receptor
VKNCEKLLFDLTRPILSEMKNWSKLIVSVIGCEVVGFLGTPFTVSAIPTWYATLNKPHFAPPNWIFGPVWTLLYFLMGIAFYLIWKLGWHKKKVKTAGIFFLGQLALNFIWSPIFFGLRAPLPGLIIIVAMWAMIVITMKKFYPLSRLAFYLLIPYSMWVSFATLLNAAIVILN